MLVPIGSDRARHEIDIGCVPVALQINNDHSARIRNRRQNGTKHLDPADAAVQQDERHPFAVDLVVHS